MCSHIKIFHASVGKILAETPTDTVHVVLHRQLSPHTSLTELLKRSQRSGQSLLVGQLIKVKIHRGQLDTTLLDPLFQSGDLFCRPALQVFTDSPRDLAGPTELRRIRIIVGRVTIIERIIDITKMLRQDLHLRASVTDIRMGVLYQVHSPMADRLDRNGLRRQFLLASCDRQRQALGRTYLGHLEEETILARLQLHPLTLVTQTKCCRSRFTLMVDRHPDSLHKAFIRLIDRRPDFRPHHRLIGKSLSATCRSQQHRAHKH